MGRGGGYRAPRVTSSPRAPSPGVFTDMDEEKESLRRQIQLLQGLIDSHKNLHGNAPADPRWQPPPTPQGVFGGGYRQPVPTQNSWRKKYSLVNRTSQGAEDAHKIPAASAVSRKPGQPKLPANQDKASEASAFRWQSAATRTQRPTDDVSSTSALRGARPLDSGSRGPAQGAAKETLRGAAKPGQKVSWTPLHKAAPAQVLVSPQPPSMKPLLPPQPPSMNLLLPPSMKPLLPPQPPSMKPLLPPQPPSMKPLLPPQPPSMNLLLPPSMKPLLPPQPPSMKPLLPPQPPSIKPPQTPSMKPLPPPQPPFMKPPQPPSKKPPQLPSMPPSKTEMSSSAPRPSAGSLGRTLTALSLPQKSNEAVTASKVSRSLRTKYIWVAESPKVPPAGKKVNAIAKRVSGDQRQKTPEAAAKGKKNGPSPKSRYRWKAENASSSTSQWSAVHKGAQRSGPVTPHHGRVPAVTAAPYRDPAHSSYKVKSKTKIIKRRSMSRSPVEKKSSPLAPLMVRSHYFLRRRSSPRVKSPPTVKRSSPRMLVHLSKHRLRRAPPPGSQQPPVTPQAASSSVKNSSSSRVINTRYRIVKRSGTPPLVTSPLSTFNSALNWRTRLLLLSRLRLKQNQQRWRSRGLCVIGGVMYRVSANKLSKTWSPGSGSKNTPRTGKVEFSGGSTSPGSFYPSRSATPSRYIASRAIQRSLAIIRQAQQKKEKKEYCMYYNRFGKCNRGQKCPYIHDPEKVAVCTRFLRGTCKKIDGSCQFSHQVSKDKMPVCSYFLKGICHNNDCPYSHVYVSRKAEVCQDFIKGYCPMGAKCKKKHTLLCPDYARGGQCPQGAKCKLQHRQRKRRLDVTAAQEQTPVSTKQRRRTPDQAGKSPLTTSAASDGQLPGSSGLQSCPSFISLNCSSSSDGTPVSDRVKSSENSGKPLQIKPRL
ncbi:zinc finger CCCH domain-containing protein 3 [Dendropsophus ebraccatus]|uniref:zinc finger CCCH domain-containing protein 3 n=1 Tax=Dendropsophus ebraccatus TaxID=150705 RepID=UPI0038318AA6